MTTDKKPFIRVWRFHQAPAEFQALSGHGGDEDWLAFVPDTMREKDGWLYIPWIETGSGFGCCDVSKHEVEGGTVYIGAHA